MDVRFNDSRVTAGGLIFVFLVLWLLWLLLAGNVTVEELAAGFIVATVVTLVAKARLGIFNGILLNTRAPIAFVRYLGYFFVALLKANFDMARRVLSPSLPLHPAVVEVKTSLQSELGRLILANSITLTPGTLSVDVRNDHILVHWVDCSAGTDLARATQEIAAGFEKHLKGFLK